MKIQIKVALLLLCIGVSTPGICQDMNLIDSLENQLKQTQDTSKLKVLNKLFWSLVFSDAQKAKTYLDSSVKLANKVGDSTFIASVKT